jgi:hypothetical protein
MGRALEPHGREPTRADVCEEHRGETGREVIEDLPYW